LDLRPGGYPDRTIMIDDDEYGMTTFDINGI